MGWFGWLNISGDGKSETIDCEMISVAGIFMEKIINGKLIGKGLGYYNDLKKIKSDSVAKNVLEVTIGSRSKI
jgi:hypothetical protein